LYWTGKDWFLYFLPYNTFITYGYNGRIIITNINIRRTMI
jgi:hypothetical protein